MISKSAALLRMAKHREWHRMVQYTINIEGCWQFSCWG